MPNPLPAGKSIASKALAALSDPAFDNVAGHCQMYARQVAEAVGGSVGAAMDAHRAGSALATMQNFQSTQYNVWENIGSNNDAPDLGFLQPGDFLYKGTATSGPYGHVGIYVGPYKLQGQALAPCVAENSSFHINPDHMGDASPGGAKGLRTLSAFGPFEMVVRLTQTAAQASAS